MKYDEELCQVMAENIENAKHYGLEEVLLQTQEEAAELIQAISKYHRAAGHGAPVKLTEEEARQQILEELLPGDLQAQDPEDDGKEAEC